MTDINNVILIGRLTRTVGEDERSFGYTQSGMCYAKLSIAVNRSKKDTSGQWADEASFFEVTLMGKMAESLKPYLTKGKKIAVEGSLKQDRWTDQQGQNHSKVSIFANSVQLLESKENNNNFEQSGNFISQPQSYEQQNQNQQGYNRQNIQQNYQQQVSNQQSNNWQDEFPEDIPF